ncbi:hypothetical protein TNCV_1977291 [Trichonephila clavipes]|nr:hypothetical protein TNCV_1977291 [Trichonephila clavipes]
MILGIKSWQGSRCILVVNRSFEHYACVNQARIHLNFEGEHYGEGQGHPLFISPFTNLTRVLLARRLFRVPPKEAHFWLNGYVNKQNCRIWSEANPLVYVETPFYPEKLTVWGALWTGGILLQKR